MYDSLSKITLGDIVSTFSTPKSPLPPTYWTILEQMYGSVDDLDQTFPQVPQSECDGKAWKCIIDMQGVLQHNTITGCITDRKPANSRIFGASTMIYLNG